jgi:hypothetical protein
MNPLKLAWPVAFVTLAPPVALAGGEHGEIGVGRTSTNQLVADIGFEQPAQIPRSIFPGYTGYAASLIGFANVPLDEPDAGVFTISPASDISARLTAADPGAAVFNGLPLLQVGESMFFGSPDFDYHPLFSIPSPTATHGQVFSLRFILHDASGLYTDSDEFTISMTPACAADFNLSGTVSVQDLFDFLAAYFRGFLDADFNRSGALSVQDLFDFLAAYFQPCP